jgi:hypothetical protein
MCIDYCIFCYQDFDLQQSKKVNNECKDIIINNINNIKNIKITLSCNHPYHLGCFVKYHPHKCKQKCFFYKESFNEFFKESCILPCPLCTIQINDKDTYLISKEIYKLHDILNTLNKKTNILFFKVKMLHFSLSIKKKITNIKLTEIYKFNRICILYDHLLQIKTQLSDYITHCQV